MNAEALARALADEDEEVRYQALQAELDPDPAALEACLGALGDRSWRVRKAAVECLVAHAGREAVIPRLVDALGDEDNAGTRNAAAEALMRIGAAAGDALAARLEDPDQDLRKFCVDVLGEIGGADAVPALVTRLGDADENVRGAAAEALGKIGGEAAEAALMDVLGGADLLVTLSALDALGRAGCLVPFGRLSPLLGKRLLRRPVLRLLARIADPAALAALVESLGDPARGTREAALGALGEWMDWHDPGRTAAKQALEALDPAALTDACALALEGRDPVVVAGAVEVLALLGAAELAPRMIEAAGDERLRERVQSALLRMGEAVTRPLLAALDGLGPAAQEVAAAVLAGIGDPRAVPELVQRLDQGDDRVRLAAVEALGLLGDERAVEPLSRYLGRADRLLSGTVIRALGALAEAARERVLDACRSLLGHEDALRVADACRVLAEVGSPAEIPLLQAVLRHEDPRAREAAVDALGALPAGEAVDQLRFGLTDESPQVRAAAARALGRQGGRPAVEALLIALQDDEPVVVGAAAEAVGEVGGPEDAVHLLPLVGEAADPAPAPAAWAAVRALGRLGAPDLATALGRAASHPEGEVVKEVAEVAADLEGEAGARILLACARHPAWDVRRVAARLLARRGDPSVIPDLEALLAGESDPLAAEGFREAVARLGEV